MTIRREDLVAAAAVGLLQYRQVEPLLVFLLQRDVRAQREAMLARQSRQRRSLRSGINVALSHVVGVLALVTAALFAVLFSSRAVQAMGSAAILLMGSAYAVGGLGLAAWLRRRGFCVRVRVAAALAIASVPLAVIALQYVIAM
jgi:hypothetical protein